MRGDEILASLRYIEVVLFDANGTLIADLVLVWRAFNKTFELYGISPLSLEAFKREFCLPCSTFLSKMGLPKNVIQKFSSDFYRFYLESLGYAQLFPDVKGCLTALRKRSIKMGVVSALPKEFLWLILKKLGIVSSFTTIIGDAPKPSPSPINQACKIIGTNPKHVIYVGDMEEDIICANRAGATPVGICRDNGSYHDKTKLETQNPKYIISDLHELVKLITKISL